MQRIIAITGIDLVKKNIVVDYITYRKFLATAGNLAIDFNDAYIIQTVR
jgi:hypothetical protein